MIIKSANYVISSPDQRHCPKPDRPEYAMIGRSNVGKSSLINMIVGKRNLAKTSATPGKTKLINHFAIESIPGNDPASKRIESWYLVDLPGYGFAKVSASEREKWEKMIKDYLRLRENLGYVFVLIDSRHKPQQVDLDFINKMGKWEISFCLVFTKSDKSTQPMVQKSIKEFLDAMKETWETLPNYFVTSATKGKGRKEILECIENMNWEYYQGRD